MLKKILSPFVILILASFCFGQKTKQSKYVVNQSQPSVYITYVKTDERIIFDDVKESFAWFRFHNNTKKKIVLSANGGVDEDDATLFYDILNSEERVIESTYCHACSVIRLSSGNSLLFSVPLNILKIQVQ